MQMTGHLGYALSYAIDSGHQAAMAQQGKSPRNMDIGLNQAFPLLYSRDETDTYNFARHVFQGLGSIVAACHVNAIGLAYIDEETEDFGGFNTTQLFPIVLTEVNPTADDAVRNFPRIISDAVASLQYTLNIPNFYITSLKMLPVPEPILADLISYNAMGYSSDLAESVVNAIIDADAQIRDDGAIVEIAAIRNVPPLASIAAKLGRIA